jgi:hypothetical protein
MAAFQATREDGGTKKTSVKRVAAEIAVAILKVRLQLITGGKG